MKRHGQLLKWSALALGLAFFALYALTAAPSIVELYDDTLEFQLVGPTFGIAHPTGYPLYTILSGLWSRLIFPIGNWAWRMNLFSALTGGTTVALLFWLTQQLASEWLFTPKNQQLQTVRINIMPGLMAAVVFGLSPVWWSQATVAEVYTLHNLLFMGALVIAVMLATAQGDATGKTTFLALFLGLGLTHHRTIVLIGPGLVILLWGKGWLWRPSRKWIQWLAALLGPLLLYLYLPLRAATGVRDLNGSYMPSWQGFWHHILARGYTGFFTENALTNNLSIGDWFLLWVQQVGWLGLALGVLGLGYALWQTNKRPIVLGLVVILVTNLSFAILYRVGDPEVFMLPAWLTFALFIGLSIAALRQSVAIPRPVGRALQAGLLFIMLIGGIGRGERINRSQDWATHNYAVALAKVDFPPGSQVIGLEGQITALRYMQQAEGLGRNAVGVVANEPAQRIAAIEDAIKAEKPVYLTQEVVGIGDSYSFTGVGPLIRVWPRGEAEVNTPEHPLNMMVADGQLALEGYDLAWPEEAGGTSLRIVLYWRPQIPLKTTYKVSLRLQDRAGASLYDAMGSPFIVDLYPLRQVALSTNWVPQEMISDVYTMPLGQTDRSAVHTLQVILYDAATVQEAGTVLIPLSSDAAQNKAGLN